MMNVFRNKFGNYVITIHMGRIFIIKRTAYVKIARSGYDQAAYRSLYRGSKLSHRVLRNLLDYVEWLDREVYNQDDLFETRPTPVRHFIDDEEWEVFGKEWKRSNPITPASRLKSVRL